jgi:hypothetical protein
MRYGWIFPTTLPSIYSRLVKKKDHGTGKAPEVRLTGALEVEDVSFCIRPEFR